MIDDITWEDPPGPRPDGVGREGWTRAFADACRQYPGKWARVVSPTGNDRFSGTTRKNLKRHGLEIKGSTLDETGNPMPNGVGRLWARWPEP